MSSVAVITGAGRGIGREVAIALAAAGFAVIVVARTEAEVAEVAALVTARGGRATAVIGDVRDYATAASAVAAATQLGDLELVVNNAGVLGEPARPWAEDPEAFWAVVEVNLRGPYNLSRAALPQLLGQGRGRIVNVGSAAGTVPVPGYAAYSVSKAGLLRLTDNLDTALRGTGVKVFDVLPARVRTAMTAAEDPDVGRWMPVGRVAAAIASLATGRYDALAGQAVRVDDDWDELVAGRATSPAGRAT